MNRFQRVLVLWLSLLLASLPQVASHAAVSPQGVRMFVDGRLIRLNPGPLVVAGRVMVPLRGTVEAMGATVSFLEPRTIVILRDPRVIELELGNRLTRVNGTPVRIDVPPIAVAGHTYIPLRFVGEALGATIRFDPSARSVHIFTSPVPEGSLPAPQSVPEAKPAPLPVPFPPPADAQPFPVPPVSRPARPTVIFPLPGTSVGNPVGVQGTAPGATRVRVSVTVPLVGIPIGSTEATVLPVLGVFSANVSYPSLFSGLPLSINVVAIDGAGVESEAVTVLVRQG